MGFHVLTRYQSMSRCLGHTKSNEVFDKIPMTDELQVISEYSQTPLGLHISCSDRNIPVPICFSPGQTPAVRVK